MLGKLLERRPFSLTSLTDETNLSGKGKEWQTKRLLSTFELIYDHWKVQAKIIKRAILNQAPPEVVQHEVDEIKKYLVELKGTYDKYREIAAPPSILRSRINKSHQVTADVVESAQAFIQEAEEEEEEWPDVDSVFDTAFVSPPMVAKETAAEAIAKVEDLKGNLEMEESKELDHLEQLKGLSPAQSQQVYDGTSQHEGVSTQSHYGQQYSPPPLETVKAPDNDTPNLTKVQAAAKPSVLEPAIFPGAPLKPNACHTLAEKKDVPAVKESSSVEQFCVSITEHSESEVLVHAMIDPQSSLPFAEVVHVSKPSTEPGNLLSLSSQIAPKHDCEMTLLIDHDFPLTPVLREAVSGEESKVQRSHLGWSVINVEPCECYGNSSGVNVTPEAKPTVKLKCEVHNGYRTGIKEKVKPKYKSEFRYGKDAMTKLKYEVKHAFDCSLRFLGTLLNDHLSGELPNSMVGVLFSF